VSIRISDIRLHLTQIQYNLLISLSKSIPKVLSGAPEGTSQAEQVAPLKPQDSVAKPQLQQADLAPEVDGNGHRTTLEVVLTIDAVKLHLYDEFAINDSTLNQHGIAKFALNDSSLRFKMLSDGSGEAQIVLKSFVVNNTRVGNSKFREIIPAAQHDRNQFMILYTMAGGSGGSSLAILTIDSPRIIFAIDLVFALLEFFTDPFNSLAAEDSTEVVQQDSVDQPKESTLDFRVDLHDVSICVLENDSDADSQAIELSIKQILLSQQVRHVI